MTELAFAPISLAQAVIPLTLVTAANSIVCAVGVLLLVAWGDAKLPLHFRGWWAKLASPHAQLAV